MSRISLACSGTITLFNTIFNDFMTFIILLRAELYFMLSVANSNRGMSIANKRSKEASMAFYALAMLFIQDDVSTNGLGSVNF